MQNYFTKIPTANIIDLLKAMADAIESMIYARNNYGFSKEELTDSFMAHYEEITEKELPVSRDFFLKENHTLEEQFGYGAILSIYKEKMEIILNETGDPSFAIDFQIDALKEKSLLLLQLIRLKIEGDASKFNKLFELSKKIILDIPFTHLQDEILLEADVDNYHRDRFYPLFEEISSGLYELHEVISSINKKLEEKVSEIEKTPLFTSVSENDSNY